MKYRKFPLIASVPAVVLSTPVAILLTLGFAAETSARPTEISRCQDIRSGSYVLTQDLTAASHEPCLTIQGDDPQRGRSVTIDLNGFTIQAATAIYDEGQASEVVVRNGMVLGDLLIGSNSQIENVTVVGDYTGRASIQVGPYSIVTGSLVTDNTGVVTPAQLEKPEPHCSNGDCSAFAEWCLLQGREPMCLNAGTDHEVTVCIGQRAKTGIMNNHPNACLGTCSAPGPCN